MANKTNFTFGDGLCVQSKPIVTINGTLNIGGIKVPYKKEYDLNDVPPQHHGLIQAIQALR